MIYRHAVWVLLIATSCSSDLLADQIRLENGLYEVQFRLELPHLEDYSIDQKTTICIDQGQLDRHELPVPLLSQGDIFASCRIENIQQDSKRFSYDIVCNGRDAASATAVYVLTPNEFSSRISIVQGAKNMTMTEVQHGSRVGSCDGPVLSPQ